MDFNFYQYSVDIKLLPAKVCNVSYRKLQRFRSIPENCGGAVSAPSQRDGGLNFWVVRVEPVALLNGKVPSLPVDR